MLKRKYSNSAVPMAIKVVIFDADTADMKFQDYNIAEDIKRSLAEAGFKRPTDIQFKAIPSILKGDDVMAIAQTGTGKTAAAWYLELTARDNAMLVATRDVSELPLAEVSNLKTASPAARVAL